MTDAPRVLLHVGKGGVGKTTVSAATAVQLARTGRRTLVVSSDPAHSLGDVLDQPLGDRPVAVAEHLDAQQLHARQRLDDGWEHVAAYLRELLRWGGAGELEAAELAVVPGLDELFALLDLRAHVERGDYDVVVVDCAPTAETLRLLNLPEALGWYVERLAPLQRGIARALRPTLRHVGALPLPEEATFGALAGLYERLQAVRAVLLDPAVTSVRMVLTPERVVLAEARRTHTLLALFGHALDAVIVNRVVTSASDDPLVAAWRRRQRPVLDEVAATFAPVPRLTVPLLGDEPVGVAALGALARDLYAGSGPGDAGIDPGEVLHDGPRLQVVDHGDRRGLRVPLPQGTPDDVELFQRRDELYVRVGGHTRNLVLPAGLGERAVTAARVEDGWLCIDFAAGPATPAERAAGVTA